MNKKLIKILLGVSLLIPTLAYCGLWDYVIGNRLKMSEMKSFAKDYAEQKYHRDYEVVSLDWQLKQVRVKPSDNSSDACWVLINTKDSNWSAKSDCGYQIITRKIVNDINKKIISKDFSSNEIRINFTCKEGTRCGLPRSQLIGDYWNLSAEEWLKKFYKYLQVDGVIINVFEIKKSPENMAKAVKLAFELNKFLYGITGTHDTRYISLLLYGVSENEFVKKYNGKFIKHILKDGKDYSFYNFWGGVKLGTCLEYNSNGRKCLDNKVITSRTNIIETLNDAYITSTVDLKREPLKDTKYYSQVKNILSNQK